MKIPSEYGTFKTKTLIVAADSVHAKLFIANGNEAAPLEIIESGWPPKGDPERVSGQHGTVNFRETAETLKIQSREKLYHALGKRLMALAQEGTFDSLALCAPAEHLDELKGSLHIDLLKRVTVSVPKLLTSEDMLDIVIHVREEAQG